MKKLAIIFDSFIGVDKETLEKDGFYYIPHRIFLDEKEYLDFITINAKDDIEKLEKSQTARTSLPSPSLVVDTFKKLSSECDDILYFSMGSAVSSTYQTINLISKDFPKVHVIDSWIVGKAAFYKIAHKAQQMYEVDGDITKILKYIDEWKSNIVSFVIPKNVDALLEGGRLISSAKYVMNKTNIIPIVSYEKKVKPKALRRTQRKAILKAVKMMKAFVQKVGVPYDFGIVYSNLIAPVNFAEEAIHNELKGDIHIHIQLASLVITVHTGIGAISISAWPVIT